MGRIDRTISIPPVLLKKKEQKRKERKPPDRKKKKEGEGRIARPINWLILSRMFIKRICTGGGEGRKEGKS